METNGSAEAWANEIAERIGVGVRTRRTELGLSAQGVADRTVEIGFPIARGTVSKIENNNRRGKVEVAELFVLAKALETSPAALVWHDASDTPAAYLPEVEATAGEGYRWMVGDQLPHPAYDLESPGESARQFSRIQALRRLFDARQAVARLSQRRHPSRGAATVPEVDVTTAYAEMERAEAEAEAHGWVVRRNG